MLKCESLSRVPLTVTPWTVAQLPRPWNSPGKNTGVDCHLLLLGVFLTHRSIPGLLRCRRLFYHLSHQGSLSSVCIQNIPPPHYLQPHHNHSHQTLPENMSQHYSSWEGLQWSPRELCFCPYFPQSSLNTVSKIIQSKCKSD